MKLYYAPGACSLSPHITLNETGVKFESEQVDLRTKKTKGGADFNAINSKGYVPALILDSGELMTEGVVMVQYIADKKGDNKLAPANGTMERYRLQETLNFIATELHKGMSPLFNPKLGDEMRASVVDRVKGRFGMAAAQLDGKQYIMGDTFTVADPYLFTMLNWARGHKIDVPAALGAYFDRVKARPAVQATIKTEGLTI